ncbi:MAG: hypothetical protein ACK58T_26615 [Phycisphaerae bacterium]
MPLSAALSRCSTDAKNASMSTWAMTRGTMVNRWREKKNPTRERGVGRIHLFIAAAAS